VEGPKDGRKEGERHTYADTPSQFHDQRLPGLILGCYEGANYQVIQNTTKCRDDKTRYNCC
jgi:hypothetical protein